MRVTLDDVRKLLLDMERQLPAPAQILVMEIPSLSLVALGEGEELNPLREAHGNACARLRLQIPLLLTQGSSFPFLFETRFVPLAAPGLTKLQAQIVDRHDTTVHKIIRGEKRDVAAIQAMSRQSGLTYSTLLDSFCAIDASAVPELRRARAIFLELIETLFGRNSAMQAEAALAERLG
ncbi:MAG: hypothetical protein NDJ89_08590 [Oligoflexia bacterium]|nr:hypothetical protein [Oligoflexia bacterium]